MNLYISEFEVLPNLPRNPLCDNALVAVLKFCERNGISYSRSNKFLEYTEIEKRIRDADILVAIVDEYWWSSTWKMQELCYALGGPPQGEKKIKKSLPTKVITFLVGEKKQLRMLSQTEIVTDIKSLVHALENLSSA